MIVDSCSDAFMTLNKDLMLPTLDFGSSVALMPNPFDFKGGTGSLGLNAPPLPTNLPTLNF